MLLVCRRPGRENLRELKKDFYSIGVELGSGRKFIYQSSEGSDTTPGKGIMFERQGNFAIFFCLEFMIFSEHSILYLCINVQFDENTHSLEYK